MRKFIILSFAAAFAANAEFVKQATQPWVANRIGEARTAVSNEISAAVAAIPLPDYSTNNAALVATIEAAAPAPGDYETVKEQIATNAADIARQSGQISILQSGKADKSALTAEEIRAKNAEQALAAEIADSYSEIYARVPNTRTVNGHSLSNDVTLSASDVGAVPVSGISGAGAFNLIIADGSGGLMDSCFSALDVASTSSVARQIPAAIRSVLATNTYNLAANAGYYLAVRDLAVAFGATVTNDPYAVPPAPAPSPEPAPSVQTRRIAMFIIPVNYETNGVFCGFELKASTNNFSHAADEATRLQYYAQSEIADTGMEGTNIWDRIRIYTGTSHGTDDVRAYTRIPNTIEWPWPLTSVVALVDASCLERHPSGDWLREDNEEIVWCYLRNRALSPPYERESGTAHSLWRPIAPVRWYKELPPWAR